MGWLDELFGDVGYGGGRRPTRTSAQRSTMGSHVVPAKTLPEIEIKQPTPASVEPAKRGRGRPRKVK